MSSWEHLEDKLYRAITGGRSPRTEGFHDALRELRRHSASAADLARKLGHPIRTVRDWLNKGTHPKGGSTAPQDVLEALRRHRLRLGREQRLRKGNLSVKAKQRYDDRRPGGQEREWRHPAQQGAHIDWDPRANGRIIDAYLAGDMRAAAEEFIRGIGDPSYQEMTDPDNDDFEVGFDIDDIELE